MGWNKRDRNWTGAHVVMISVTGATGYLGNVLMMQLAHADLPTRIVCRENTDLSNTLGSQTDIARVDFQNVTALGDAFKGSEFVLHVAGLVSIMPFMSKALYTTNVQCTRNVLEACSKAGVKRLIYVSSIHAIPSPPGEITIDESLPIDPAACNTEYGKTKAKATIDVLRYGRDGNLECIALCPTGIIGPYDHRGSQMGRAIKMQIKRGTGIYVSGAYDFVDVRDVAEAIRSSMWKGQPNRHYVLSGGRVSVKELYTHIHEQTGSPAPKIKIPNHLVFPFSYISAFTNRSIRRDSLYTPDALKTLWSNSNISSKLARTTLGYSSRPWRESLSEQIGWMQANGVV